MTGIIEPQTQEAAVDPARTPEAASGKVDWNFTFPFMLDSGEEVQLPYLAPSFAEIRAVKDMSQKSDADLALTTMRKYLSRRIGEDTKLFKQVIESMSFQDIGGYIEWSSNPTGRTPGKAS